MARRRALNPQSGISLVELIVVAAIAMVLFALAIPVMQSDDVAGATARSLISDAVRARSYARRAWEPVTMQVDATNNRWRALTEGGVPLDDTGADADGWKHPDAGVEFKNVDGFPGDLTFLPNGRATESAAMYIVTGSTQWMITVDALSARITAVEMTDEIE